MTGALVVGTMIGSGIFMLPVSLAPLGANAPAAWDSEQHRRAHHRLRARPPVAARRRRHPGQCRAPIGARRGFPRCLVLLGVELGRPGERRDRRPLGAVVAQPPARRAGLGDPGRDRQRSFLHRGQRLRRALVGGRVVITVAIKLLPLAGVILIFALRAAGSARLEPLAAMPITFANLATATALTFFALTGFENATTPVDKVRDPARTIPRAIIGGTLFVAILNLFASTAVQLLLPAAVVCRIAGAVRGSHLRAMGRRRRDRRRARRRGGGIRLPQRPDPRHRRARLCHGPEARPAGGDGVDLARQHAGGRADRRPRRCRSS